MFFNSTFSSAPVLQFYSSIFQFAAWSSLYSHLEMKGTISSRLQSGHGESRDNVRGKIGGDLVLGFKFYPSYFLSDKGELYARKLSNFVEKRLKFERAVLKASSLFASMGMDHYPPENNLDG